MTTVTLGQNTGNTAATTTLLWLRSSNPTVAYTSTAYVVGPTDPSNTVLMFDLSAIPAGATINSASVGIRASDIYGDTGHTVDFHRLLRVAVSGQASWNNYSTGNAWTTAGALGGGTDRVATATATSPAINNTDSYVVATGLEDDVQYFLDTANTGWLLVPSGIVSQVNTRINSETAADGRRPYLTVTYTEATSFSPAWAINSNQVIQ